MHPDKKITKEDTWKADDLRKHIRGGGREEDHGRKRVEYERQHRGGESLERRQRDSEREARRERDKRREKDSTQERKARDVGTDDPYLDGRKGGSKDGRGEREEREKERRGGKDGDGESRDRRHYREEKENRDRGKEKARERDRDEDRTRERDGRRDRENEREERDREIRREERERERRAERDKRRGEERGEGARDRDRQHESERREGHRDKGHRKESEYHDKRRDEVGKERHSDLEISGQREDREYREQRRREKDDRERRHKERAQLVPAESHRRGDDPREAARGERKASEDRHRADREGAERERRRERRRREEAGPERELTERSSDQRTASSRDPREKRESVKKEVQVQSQSVWRSSQKELSDTEEPAEKEDPPTEDQAEYDGDAQDYEEDFEDYEEDFEEAEESDGEEERQTHRQEEREEEGEELSPQRRKEIEAIQRAMKEENERVGTAPTRLSREEEERPRRTRGSETLQTKGPQQGRFIDFVAAKHREVNRKVASEQKKRSAELLRLIDLDFSTTFSLLDLPPVNEYDMYIKSFGTTNTKQAYVQCNEDNTDRDVQTEETERSEKWTQHPAEWNAICGGPNVSQEDSDSTHRTNIDSQRLASFLRSASQVVAVLLEEDGAERQSLKKLRSQAETLQSFSDGCLQLNTKLPFLHGRSISLVHFHQVQRQTMLSVHSPAEKPSAVRLDSKTVICIWNIWEPSRPQKVLVYESEVRSCCFSPGKATLVFAGTSVGSVVLWDLREHASNHYTLRIGENDWTLRHPTFSTDAVLAASSHMSSVSSVDAVPATLSGGLRPELPLVDSDEESSGLSFQLASLDENGVLNLWVVLELPKTNEAGSQTDLGLRPGGKVKLLHSSTIHTSERNSTRKAVKTSPPQTLLLKFLPSDPSHFFIGTNMGVVKHGTSHGLKAGPKSYRPKMVGARPVDVTSIHFSPCEEAFFLVGCADGSVRLHTVASELPVLEWAGSTAGQPVVSLQWAPIRPTVFCVLDAASNLHIWDLLERDFEPVVTEKTDADRVTAMAVFGDSMKQNTFSGIALARQSGKIEMQYFTKRFTVPDSGELEKLLSLKEEAF